MLERDDPFHQTVCRLTLNRSQPLRVEGMGPDIAVLRPADPKRRVLVIRHPTGGGEPDGVFTSNLKKLLKSFAHELDVVLIGGDESARRLLKKARPTFVNKMQYMHHISEDGGAWSEKKRSISAILDQPWEILDDEWDAFEERLATDAKEISGELEEARGFRSVLVSGSAAATRALLAIIAVMYVAELVFGGPESAPTLLRLGALSPRLVLDGELYRLFSVAALHGGLYHIFFCSMVLWNLGSFLERITGTARFTLLFVSSVIAGSIASILLVKPTLSVGSSGGLWGVLAAQGVIAWFGRGVLPKAMVPGARKAAVINLGLNVFVSLLPHVDWGAHLGGAIAGGIIMFLMLPGLPRLDELEASGERPARPLLAMPARVAAAILGALFVGSVIFAVWDGQAWELRQEPRYKTVVTEELDARLDIPDILELNAESTDEERLWGDIFIDPAMIGLQRFSYATTREEELNEKGVEALMAELNQPPLPGAELANAARSEPLAGTTVYLADHRLPNGLALTVIIVPTERAAFRVEAYAWPDRPAWTDVAKRVASSIAATSP